jgi:hypothetical protein
MRDEVAWSIAADTSSLKWAEHCRHVGRASFVRIAAWQFAITSRADAGLMVREKYRHIRTLLTIIGCAERTPATLSYPEFSYPVLRPRACWRSLPQLERLQKR